MRRQPLASNRGHTLLEVMVALGVFVFLGGALVALLDQGVSIWRLADGRGKAYERARAILDQAADDLRAVATDVRRPDIGPWLRLLCDRDAEGRQRLRLVRALANESSDPIGRRGGEYLARGDSSAYDHHQDDLEIAAGRLLAPAGYQEVLYAMDPDPQAAMLWRGLRSPIGGVRSLFFDGPADGEAAAAAARKSSAPEDEAALAKRRALLDRIARPLAGGVLHFGLRFWTPFTTAWDEVQGPAGQGRPGKPSGPTSFWDSTRALLDVPAKPDGFAWKRREGSLENPDDDVFPERVEITLVLRENPEVGDLRLSRAAGAGDNLLWLSSTAGLPADGPLRYVFVDGEWIRYEKVEGDRLHVAAGGRGARETRAAAHAAGARVELGSTFRRVVELPGYFSSQDLGDGDGSGRRRTR
jgi:hypothetical protein